MKLANVQEALLYLRRRPRGDAVQKVIYTQRIRSSHILYNDEEYRKEFRIYYRLRNIDSDIFFNLLGKYANSSNSATVLDVVDALYEGTGDIHLSFATKLMATLDDGASVFDSEVAGKLRIPNYSLARFSDWRLRVADRYERLQSAIGRLIESPEWPETERQFDAAFPHGRGLSVTRKADLLVWSRPSELVFL